MSFNNIKALSKRVSKKSLFTLFYILENLAVNRILKKRGREGVYGSLKRQSEVFRTAGARSPARSHWFKYQHQGFLYKRGDDEVKQQSEQQD